MPKDIAIEIKKGEGRRLEFKQLLPKGNQLAKTAIAFANGAGGKIIVGIADKTNTISGLTEAELIDYPDKISGAIYDACLPRIIPEIYFERIENKTILIIQIHASYTKPCYLKSEGNIYGVFVRVGAINKRADSAMIAELHRQSLNISFDEEINEEVRKYQHHINTIISDFKAYTTTQLSEDNLISLKFLKYQNDQLYPSNALLLLAGDACFNYAKISCALFKGSTMEHFLDRKEFSGPIYRQVEQAMLFVQSHLSLSSSITGLQRKDKYEIPIVAIRELLVNAAVHRDYSMAGSDIKLAIFSNRIEISSPGTLPKSLDIETIQQGRSEIRNKVIARFFKEIGFVEQWGSGIPKAIQLCVDAGLKPPTYIENANYLKVIINKGVAKKKDSKIKAQKETTVANSRVTQLLKLMAKDKKITLIQLAKILNVTTRTITRDVNQLKQQGFLVRVGSDKDGYWKIMSL